MGMIGALGLSQAVVAAWRGETVRVAGADFRVPGTRRIRLSVVAGNVRMHRLLDRFVRPGATVVDVGANIGYNTIHAARVAGPVGRVFAVEPTPDNLEVLRGNLRAAGTANVIVVPVAAGRVAGTRTLFVRGARSAVNSLFEKLLRGRDTAAARSRHAVGRPRRRRGTSRQDRRRGRGARRARGNAAPAARSSGCAHRRVASGAASHGRLRARDRKSTRLNSSHSSISYAV